MPSQTSHQRFPVALLDQQIVYVTENDRDAEAVSCEIDCPVIEDGSTPVVPNRYFPIVIRKHPGRPNARRVRNVSNVRNVQDVSEMRNIREVSNVTHVPNASDVSNVSEVRDARDIQSHHL